MNNSDRSYYAKALGEASNSAMRRFRISPEDYLDYMTGDDKPSTPPMRVGTALHMALHEPERFSSRYMVIPGMPLRSKDNRRDFLNCVHDITGIPVVDNGADADGLRDHVHATLASSGIWILTDKELTDIRGMVASLNKPCNAMARGIVSRGQKELELRWTDPESGIKCKALLDSWDAENRLLSDVKRTESISEREFRNSCYGFGYHHQLAFYRRGLRANGFDVDYSCFTCGSPVGRVYPWAIYDFEPEVLDACDDRMSRDLDALTKCLATNNWPPLNGGEPRTVHMNVEYI